MMVHCQKKKPCVHHFDSMTGWIKMIQKPLTWQWTIHHVWTDWHLYLCIYIYIWANYNNSLTWNLQPFWDDSRLRGNRVRQWWNLAIGNDLLFFCLISGCLLKTHLAGFVRNKHTVRWKTHSNMVVTGYIRMSMNPGVTAIFWAAN